MTPHRIHFKNISRSRRQLTVSFGIDDLTFDASYWYEDVDLLNLEKRFGPRFMNKVYFHILAFEAMKLVSLAPGSIDLGEFAVFHTPTFERLWDRIVTKVWAQWRYENNIPDYAGPQFLSRAVAGQIPPVGLHRGEIETLSFCGGGKDSYVAAKLLERANIPFASFAYSNSVYGPAQPQHDLIDKLLDHSSPVKRHRLTVLDTISDAPLQPLYPEFLSKSGLTSAETPASIFAVLPLALQHGYRYLVLAHERSANTGNLIWSATGEDVNHQWGKSLEAERLLNDYLQSEFVTDCQYFSLLQPIHDAVIFNLLRDEQNGVAATHSCNLRKPWCKRCPKCAYVWLNYMAYLDPALIDSMFNENLFDLEENQVWFREMLGLDEHTPFECIGQIEESRLAFELCRRKGLKGKAMDMYKKAFPDLKTEPILDQFLRVDKKEHHLPDHFASSILPRMEQAAHETREYIERIQTAR